MKQIIKKTTKRSKVYNKLEKSTKIKLIRMLNQENKKIKEVAKLLKINYNSAKTIWRNYRLEQKAKANRNSFNSSFSKPQISPKNSEMKENSSTTAIFSIDDYESRLKDTEKEKIFDEFSKNISLISQLIEYKNNMIQNVEKNNQIISSLLEYYHSMSSNLETTSLDWNSDCMY